MREKNKNRIDLKWKPKKCLECGGKIVEMLSHHPDGVPYRYWHCTKCGDEVLDMEQLYESAEIYRKLKKAKLIKVSQWGTAVAIRIPKEIAQKQRLKPGVMMRILPEKIGFKVIPEKE